jgi:hypothetical protein
MITVLLVMPSCTFFKGFTAFSQFTSYDFGFILPNLEFFTLKTTYLRRNNLHCKIKIWP